MPPSLIDIGANLTHPGFQDDLQQVLTDALAAGVQIIMVTGTSVKASEHALALARQYPGQLYATAGVHPHDATGFTPQTLNSLKRLAANPEVKALGETGLDFHRNYSPRDRQLEAYEAQLQLGTELGLPLFLHQRDAHQDFHALLQRYRADLGRVVVHCFTGTVQELEDYLALDTYIGITGWICDERRGLHLHELISMIPVDRLMLETDSPYLLPRNIQPRPGTRRNEPANLPWILKKVAQCLALPEAEVAEMTRENARVFFGLDKLC